MLYSLIKYIKMINKSCEKTVAVEFLIKKFLYVFLGILLKFKFVSIVIFNSFDI